MSGTERNIKVYRYRVKNRTGELNRMARAVNFVWNYACDVQKHAVKWGQKWPSNYELHSKTSGTCEELGLLASTVASTCTQFVQSRRHSKRRKLRFRGKRSLGWVPFRALNIHRSGSSFIFRKQTYRVAYSRPIPPEAKILDGGSFSQDALGNWYLNVCVELPIQSPATKGSVGIDLGLKDLAALSDGRKVENPRIGALLATRLAAAQRARKRRQIKAIHAKIANQRRDYLHKASTALANEFGHIVVGNVNAAALKKTRMAKSVGDAGWSTLRNFLQYKANARGGIYEEVSEHLTTQLCSNCGAIGGPSGSAELAIRQWTCDSCGTSHDRDRNAAINILARAAHRTPAEGAVI